MPNTCERLAVASGLVLLMCLVARATPMPPQGTSGAAPAVTPSGMTEQQWRGEGLFIQRCSICHQLRKLKNLGSPPVVGPDLAGVFAKATPEGQKGLRDLILKGSTRMPGFQYGLESSDIDDLIAYLKIKTQ